MSTRDSTGMQEVNGLRQARLAPLLHCLPDLRASLPQHDGLKRVARSHVGVQKAGQLGQGGAGSVGASVQATDLHLLSTFNSVPAA